MHPRVRLWIILLNPKKEDRLRRDKAAMLIAVLERIARSLVEADNTHNLETNCLVWVGKLIENEGLKVVSGTKITYMRGGRPPAR
jgi:hypothetical protein